MPVQTVTTCNGCGPSVLCGHETCPACGGVLIWANGVLVCPRRSCGEHPSKPSEEAA